MALGFQYIGGYPPCPLCLAAAARLLRRHPCGLRRARSAWPPTGAALAAVLFLAVAAGFLANRRPRRLPRRRRMEVLGGPGHLWRGASPQQDCWRPAREPEKSRVVRCDEASWRFIGPIVRRLECSDLARLAAGSRRRRRGRRAPLHRERRHPLVSGWCGVREHYGAGRAGNYRSCRNSG